MLLPEVEFELEVPQPEQCHRNAFGTNLLPGYSAAAALHFVEKALGELTCWSDEDVSKT